MEYSRLDLGDTTDLRVSVVRDPMPTLISLVADVYGHRPQGVVEPWRRLVRESARVDAAAVLHPMFAPRTPVLPDCISPLVHDHGRAADPTDHFERIRETAPAVLLGELHRIFGADLPAQWRPVAAAPKRWLHGVAEVMAGTWSAFAPVWNRASALFDREFERVGSAMVRSASETVFLGLGSRHRYKDGVLHIEDRYPADFSLQGRTLAFVPVVSSSAPTLCELDDPHQVWLGYAMPGQGRLHSSEDYVPPRTDALGTAIGRTRAHILRMLTAPATMSDIAAWINATAPAATYHCRQLEDAGLLTRYRHGLYTEVRRTLRGEALIDLFR
ncbi:transcriptional regulator, MarR family [Catenulispora acidiphila DSM 44928]|uniref:Transcriptional regulator, MarR family n=1 Tax=Catenulispora acidiphila (strain DSM 44928 / JCM 14897 / NBRC 102108 / NRRL B-24433 / ID139908) TaxID=479433 RepID=C7Q7U0_CATAD|nr:winged helix-turn-helix domain-containing protein [Catenulispora acidiphila]ACU72283.1 transcriptional regulator, MarR family [Catenulispora acidiphila DSM 44928]